MKRLERIYNGKIERQEGRNQNGGSIDHSEENMEVVLHGCITWLYFMAV